MQVSVGEHHEAAVQRAGVFASLFFADQRILVLGLGLQHDEREALSVEQQKVDEAFSGCSRSSSPKRVEVGRLDGDAGFKPDVGRVVAVGKETPASGFEQIVDLDAGGGFVHSVVILYLLWYVFSS